MKCEKCGKSFQDDAVFCPYCGKKQVNLPRKNPSRANGTGSVYYDSRAKKWVAQIVTGKHYTENEKIRFSYKRQNFEKKSDALKAVGKLEEKKKARPNFTLSYYYVSFSNGKGCTLSQSKQTAYKIAYNRLKTLWSAPMKDLTVNDLQTALSASCSSYDTARDVRALLNYLFKLAAADDRSINPVLPSLLQIPKQEETQVEPFTEEEQLQLWYSYESGKDNAAIPLIMIYTGMMTGEMRKLSKSMIHLDDKTIIGAGLKTKERKKKAILLPDDIIPVLDDVISKADNDLLFDMHKETFYKRFYQALKDAGIERKLSPYSCRHTTATVLAVHENIAPQTVQRVMRWKSTRMMDRYVTPSDQDARTAVNRI